MRGLAIRIGIVVVLIIGALILRPFISGGAGDLNVGDCFDPPAGSGTVTDVQHHPCTDAHGGEVIYIGKMADAPSLPDENARQTWVADNCIPAYATYTGTDVLTTADWTINFYSPTADGWSKGDRSVICYATRLDGTQTKGSLKKAS
jgi:putative regulator of septum formation